MELDKGANIRIEQEARIIATWLSPLDSFEVHNAIYSRHLQDSGQWLIQSDSFQGWLTGQAKCLVLCGARKIK